MQAATGSGSGSFEFELNGKVRRVSGISPNITLLQYLRANGLLGAKEGCAEGDCGACSVALFERSPQGNSTCRAINSCLVPVCALAGRAVLTVEGLAPAPGSLHPVQQAMVDRHASQCGYCTPGIVMSLVEGCSRPDLNQEWKLADQLCGNLCRCTGYRPIREAALQAFAACAPARLDENHLAASMYRDAAPLPMDYRHGDERYFRPDGLPELFRLLAAYPKAQLVAGATEIGLRLTKHYERFPVLVSLEAVPELLTLEEDEQAWRLGGAVSLTRVWEFMGDALPAFQDVLRGFGSRQIRNRATLGGNLATASPIGDAAPVLLAMDASLVLASAEGERTLPVSEFFVGYRTTALQAGEVLREVIIPKRLTSDVGQRQATRFYKVSRRKEMDISTVSAAFTLVLDGGGRITAARVAYGGVAPLPKRAETVERMLVGQTLAASLEAQVRTVLSSAYTPISDVRGSAEYRKALVLELFGRFLAETCEGNQGETPCADVLVPAPLAYPGAWPHESGHKHVAGTARYVDDLAAGQRALDVWPVCSPHARAHIVSANAEAARQVPGVTAILFAGDIPGPNQVGPVRPDEPLLAEGEVFYHGQMVALVVGTSLDVCRQAASLVEVEYEPLVPVLGLREAIEQKSYHTEGNHLRRGDLAAALAAAPRQLGGELEIGGQDHFYLETHAALAEPGEDGAMRVVSSTQHPSEVQLLLAKLLAVPANRVVVECPRMGGAFGGKETQGVLTAGLAAVAARITGQPVRMRLNRDQDMIITGKRHPFLARFAVGFDDEGLIHGVRAALVSDGGWSLDLSTAVTDRALFHLDNAYYLPAVEFSGRVARTNVASNTAFRGFGGPQGMVVMEEIMDRVARAVHLPPELVRQRNLYRGDGPSRTTHYGQVLDDDRVERVWHELIARSDFALRRRQLAAWNAEHRHRKRGLAITPVKFGISFTVTHLNQAGALVLIYQDGTVQVNHGGTEMGQGIHTNMLAIASKELGITPDRVRVMVTSTEKVPNTSATAASSGTDLNGAAVRQACMELRARLLGVACHALSERAGRALTVDDLEMGANAVSAKLDSSLSLPFKVVVQLACQSRVSLSATGFYKTPGIHWDWVQGRGKPFHYFGIGAAVAEVEVDGRTGVHQLLRVDILHDAGDSINPAVNRGQIEGGFIQGAGWLTTEQVAWDAAGRLLTHSPDTYKIPAFGDVPRDFRVSFLSEATQTNNVYGSKAVGEPPLMLALSVREAIRDAVAAFGQQPDRVDLALPATAEAIYWAVQQVTPEAKVDRMPTRAQGLVIA
ncbi:MAG TPA: xanthine dehydrogenase molybdopterin binding subunit [Chthoniobacterales bacterium]